MRPLRAPRILATLVLAAFLLQSGGLMWVGLYATSRAVQAVQTARTAGIVAALQRVPKGTGKCDFCKKISRGKAAEDEQKSRQAAAQIELQPPVFSFEPSRFSFARFFFNAGYPSPASLRWHSRADCPPVPPPRAA